MKSKKIQIVIKAEIAEGGIDLGMAVSVDGSQEKTIQPHEIIGLLEMLKNQVMSTRADRQLSPDATKH